VSPQLVDYLRRHRTWAMQEIEKAIKKEEATAHLLLAAYDVKANPKIFRIEVTNAGALQANNAPLGGGKP
jgi:hypothetical protein